MSSNLANISILSLRLFRNASGKDVITSIFTIIVGQFLVRVVYRLFFHPLSKFPGPKFDTVSHAPTLIATWKGEQHKRVALLYEQYGSVVRIAPDELSFTDPDEWKHTWTWQQGKSGRNGATSLIIAEDVDHTRMQRIFSPVFSDCALKQQEPLFMKDVNSLAKKLREGIEKDPNHKFDMVKMYNFTTFDVMGDLIFGEPLHMLSRAKYDPWVTAILAGVKISTRLGTMVHYPIVERIFKALVPRSNFSKERVTKRLEKGREHEGVDIWALVSNKSGDKGLTRTEMDNNAALFMITGPETTATLVSGLTWLSLDYPRAMKELTTKIRGAFTSPEDMAIEKCAALPYLNACLKEALCLYPPVATGRPRVSLPQGPTICGHCVPPGWIVSAPHLAMYKSASNFKDPHSFVPERWLGDPRFENDKRHGLQPFHVGPRDCLGKNMAYHEMRLIMARVLQILDIDLCKESKGWINQDCYVIWEKKPLMCTLDAVN